MAGTLVLTDTIKQSYNDIAGNVYKYDRRRRAISNQRHRREQEGDPRHDRRQRCSTRFAAHPALPAAEPQVRRRGVGRRSRRRPARQQPQPCDPDRHGDGSTTAAAEPDATRRRVTRRRPTRSSSTSRRPTRASSRSATPSACVGQDRFGRVPPRGRRDVRRQEGRGRCASRGVRAGDGGEGARSARSVQRDHRRRRSPACRRASSWPNNIDGRVAQRQARSHHGRRGNRRRAARQRERSSRS